MPSDPTLALLLGADPALAGGARDADLERRLLSLEAGPRVQWPYTRVKRNSALAVASDTEELITWEQVDYGTDDPAGQWSPSDPTRLYTSRPGVYVAGAVILFQGFGGTGCRELLIDSSAVAGTNHAAADSTWNDGATSRPIPLGATTMPIRCGAGDYFQCLAYQRNSTAAARSVLGGGQGPIFALAWLGP